jgi:hypothetical protein
MSPIGGLFIVKQRWRLNVDDGLRGRGYGLEIRCGSTQRCVCGLEGGFSNLYKKINDLATQTMNNIESHLTLGDGGGLDKCDNEGKAPC